MLRMFKKYFAALFHGWVGIMSGIASVVLTFLPLVLPGLFANSHALERATWAAAAICFVIASYSAWVREHTQVAAKEAEIVRLSKAEPLPLIKGVLSNFRFGGIMSTGHTDGKWKISGAVNCDVYLCNQKPRETNLQKIELDGSELTPPLIFGPPQLIAMRDTKNINAVAGTVLADGKGVTLTNLLVSVHLYDFQDKSKIPPVDLKKLKAFAVDGFLTKHPLEVKDGETLSFW
jgi:hypothetical protein